MKKKKKNIRWGRGLVLAIIILVTGNLFFYFYYYSRSRQNPLKSPKTSLKAKRRISSKKGEKKPSLSGGKNVPDSEKKKTPNTRFSIVIDDIGYALEPLKRLLDLEEAITFAVIPHLRHSTESAKMIREAGRELILHLPMEPHRFADRFRGTQPGMLKMEMTETELLSQLKRSLSAVPGVVGVNNHLGSKFTEDRGKMILTLDWIKTRGLFFLDSRTSSQSIGWETAGELGVRRARRNVFLDNDDSLPAIEAEWDRLVEIAQKKGQAVAIGHPRRNTIDVLARFLPELPGKGIQLVSLSRIISKNP